MQKQLRRIPLTLAVIALFAGCATVQQGNDPAVVNAERTTASAAEVFNTLFTTEMQNHALILRRTPQIAHGINVLRKQAPPALNAANSAIRAYKNNRTPDKKANVLTAVAVVQSLLDTAKGYLTQIQ